MSSEHVLHSIMICLILSKNTDLSKMLRSFENYYQIVLVHFDKCLDKWELKLHVQSAWSLFGKIKKKKIVDFKALFCHP